MSAEELHGESVRLRPLRPGDEAAIVAVIAAPENAEWWPAYDEERVRREYFEDHDGEAELYAIEVDGSVVGFIQSHEEDDPDDRHAGDVTLAPSAPIAGSAPTPCAPWPAT